MRSGSNHYASDGQPVADLEHLFEELLDAALDEADQVKDRGRIAGSVGPLRASYRPDLHPDLETATTLYTEIVQRLAPRVDVILFETAPSITAAKAALAAGRTADKPVWLALTVNDSDGSKLRSGEPVAEAAKIVAAADAILINCSMPEAIPAALTAAAQAGKPIGAYANGFTKLEEAFVTGGTTVAALSARQELTPEVYARHVLDWVAHGATIVGGCCEVGPAHIREMARQLIAAGHTIT